MQYPHSHLSFGLKVSNFSSQPLCIIDPAPQHNRSTIALIIVATPESVRTVAIIATVAPQKQQQNWDICDNKTNIATAAAEAAVAFLGHHFKGRSNAHSTCCNPPGPFNAEQGYYVVIRTSAHQCGSHQFRDIRANGMFIQWYLPRDLIL